jgi:hypothetical protein
MLENSCTRKVAGVSVHDTGSSNECVYGINEIASARSSLLSCNHHVRVIRIAGLSSPQLWQPSEHVWASLQA